MAVQRKRMAVVSTINSIISLDFSLIHNTSDVNAIVVKNRSISTTIHKYRLLLIEYDGSKTRWL